MMMSPSLSWRLFLFLSLCMTCSYAQGCSRLTASELPAIIAGALEVGDPTAVTIHRHNFLCFAHASRLDEYRAASVAVNFTTPAMPLEVAIISLFCTPGGSWVFNGLGLANSSSFDLPLKENCSDCTNNANSYCTACNAMCDQLGGSGRCFGSGPTQCCPFYLSTLCISSLSGCPSGSTVNSTTFVCSDLVIAVPVDNPLPHPSIIDVNTVFIDVSVATIRCHGLSGGLVWTSDNPAFPPDLSTNNNTHLAHAVTVNPRELSLILMASSFSTPTNYTCFSTVSSATASVYISARRGLVNRLTNVQQPLTAGSTVFIYYMIAADPNGIVNGAEGSINVQINETVIPFAPTTYNPFVYEVELEVSSTYDNSNLTVSSFQDQATLLLSVASPNVIPITQPPYHFLSRTPVTLTCQSSSVNAPVTWLSNSTGFLPSTFTVNGSSISFVPYIANFNSEMYPPSQFGLPSIDPRFISPPINMVRVDPSLPLVCTVCDNIDMNSSTCTYSEFINPQFFTVRALFHPVSLALNDVSMYNNSIATDIRSTNTTLSCFGAPGNSNLTFNTDVSVLAQYLIERRFDAPFELSNGETVTVQQIDDYHIELRVSGRFPSQLDGNYGCVSMESGVETSVSVYSILEFLQFPSPTIQLTLGTETTIPFQASFLADGSPARSSLSDLSVSRSTVVFSQFETSPYNFVLYISPVTIGFNNTFIFTLGEGTSRSVFFNVTIPTLTAVSSIVIVREGESANMSCIPSDSNVKLEWRFQPTSSSFVILISAFNSDYTFDSPLMHTLTLTNTASANGEGIYHCRVQGDFTQLATPGVITLNVLQTCPESIDGGITWPMSAEGQTISRPCSLASSKFSSNVVMATRQCLSRQVWSPVLWNGCTLSTNIPNSFELFTLTLSNATSISEATSRQTLMTNELSTAISAVNDNFLDVAIINYILFNSQVVIVGEAMYNTSISDDYQYPFQTMQTLAGFSLQSEGHITYGFQPSTVCECRAIIQTTVSVIPDGGPGGVIGMEEGGEIVPSPGAPIITVDGNGFFQRLCYGVVAIPCECIFNGNCTCSSPYVGVQGTVANCTIDTDSDGFPDVGLDPVYADECDNLSGSNDSQPIYCIDDSCPNLYNPRQETPPVCEMTAPITGNCPAETDTIWNIQWVSSAPNTTDTQSCPGAPNSIGLASRRCSVSGIWLSVDVSSCRSRVLVEIQSTVDVLFAVPVDQLTPTQVATVAMEANELVDELNVQTNMSLVDNVPLFPSDLSTVNDVISNTINALNTSFLANNATAVNQTAIVDVLSNILESVNIPSWQSLQENDPTMGSELLLSNAENYGFYLAQVTPDPNGVLLSRRNIVMRAQQVPLANVASDATGRLSFPLRDDLVNFTAPDDSLANSLSSAASISIPNSLILERTNSSDGTSSVPIVNTIFNNLQDFLQASNVNGTIQPGTIILSSQVAFRGRSAGGISPALLADPVSLTFTVLPDNFSSPSCVFWDFSNPIGQGSWSTAGITTDNSSSPIITCLSTHLTSFAVLVDVAGSTTTIDPVEARVLSVLTYIGLSISIVCLVATIIFFIFLPIYQKKFLVHNFVHLNLSICLLMAYIVFIAGIETAVGDKVGCTIVAAILHYLFLSVFFWMLSEGVMLYLMLMVVFSTLIKRWWFFFLLGWVPAIFPVAITVGITHDYYVNETLFCWLSSSSHVIWSFVIPMVLVVIINTVFLVLVIIKIVQNRGNRNARKLEENKRVDLVVTTIKASVILLPLLGITWVIGLFAINQGTSIFAWLFVIFNSLQGAAIFFFHVVRNELVWNFIMKKFQKYLPLKDSTETSGTSGAYPYGKYKKKDSEFNTLSTNASKSDNNYELAPVMTAEQEKDIEKAPMDHNGVEMETEEAVMLNDMNESASTFVSQDKNKNLHVEKSETSQSDDERGSIDEEKVEDYKLRYTNR